MPHSYKPMDYAAATRAELSVLVIKSLFVGFEKRHGRVALTRALTGLPVDLTFLEDRRNWFSFELLVELLERLSEASGSADFSRYAGRLTVSEEVLGLTYSVMRAVGSPRMLYRYLFGNAHLYNRVGRFELLQLSDTDAEVVYTPLRTEWNDTSLILENRLGQFEAMPTVFGLPAAQVEVHKENCGDVTCVRYRLHWLPMRRAALDWRLWLAFAAACGVAWIVPQMPGAPSFPAGTLFPVVVWIAGWTMLRHRHQAKDAKGLVQLLESTLAQAQARHEELRTANLGLEALRRQLEQKVQAQDQELQKRFEALQEAYAELERLATRDELTGLHNRRSGNLALSRLVDAHASTQEPLTLLLFDLDFFKKVNDTWGHAAGDTVLSTVGRVLLRHFPLPMLAVRFGGEEFLVLLPGLSIDQALERVTACHDELRATHPLSEAPEYSIRVSSGLVSLAPAHADGPAMLAAADELLYAAKRRGRDRILHQPRNAERGITPRWTDSSFGAGP